MSEQNDWAAKVKAIEATGMSLTDIGKEVGLSPSSMSDLKRGDSKEPRGMAAVKLFELHQRVCPDLAPQSQKAA